MADYSILNVKYRKKQISIQQFNKQYLIFCHSKFYLSIHFYLTDKSLPPGPKHYQVKKRKKGLFSTQVLHEAALYNLVAMTMRQRAPLAISEGKPLFPALHWNQEPPILRKITFSMDRSLHHIEAQQTLCLIYLFFVIRNNSVIKYCLKLNYANTSCCMSSMFKNDISFTNFLQWIGIKKGLQTPLFCPFLLYNNSSEQQMMRWRGAVRHRVSGCGLAPSCFTISRRGACSFAVTFPHFILCGDWFEFFQWKVWDVKWCSVSISDDWWESLILAFIFFQS